MENTDKSESIDNNDTGAMRYIFGFIVIFGVVLAGINYMTPDKDAELQKNLVDIYQAIDASQRANNVNSDMLIRIFHYIKPHKTTTIGCKECQEIEKYYKNLENDHE